MTIITITNVRRFDGDTIDKRSKITFKASPGNVMDIDSQPDEIIDGTGCTIMPGLIDSKIDADASISSLHKFASHGITTVIDLSSGSIHCETMRSASLEAPGLTSYMSAGSGMGSHDNVLSSAFQYRAIRGISSGGEAEDLVAQDSTGHSQTNFVRLIADVPGLDDTTLLLAVDAAHRRGKLAIAYASQADSYHRALKSGFDISRGAITPHSMLPLVGSLRCNQTASHCMGEDHSRSLVTL